MAVSSLEDSRTSEQPLSAVGSDNIIVQLEGQDDSVIVGRRAYLKLTRYLGRAQVSQILQIDPELHRLSPYSRSTPLIGREAELASLQSFLDDERPVLVRVLSGEGGRGKTRLALQLTDQASATGWAAGFVTRSELGRFFSCSSCRVASSRSSFGRFGVAR